MAVTAEEMLATFAYPHPDLANTHQDGVSEPWIAEAVCALLKARGGNPVVMETGGFLGVTSAWLALTLQRMGGGDLCVCEIESARADAINQRLSALPIPDVKWLVARQDVMLTIQGLAPKSLDFVWLDDDHTKPHVESEIVALWPKMKKGGIICFHDVFGVTDLHGLVAKYGGTSLDFPRLGPAGGLGILQIPTWTAD